MADYVVRVELHGASREDYQRLYERMKQGGFVDVILGNNGRWYKMPPGEYYISNQTPGSGASIRQRAEQIAAAIRPDPGILVTESVGCNWSGLPFA